MAHLSDPHLGPLPRPAIGELRSKRASGWLSWELRRAFRHRAEVLDAVLVDIAAWRPDHIIVTGDLANLSLPEEYVRAAAWLRRLGPASDVSVVPGNHDAYIDGVWRAGWQHWAPWMSDDAGRFGFPWYRHRPPLLLIGVSSAVASPWFHATGTLGPDQLAALERLLASLTSETAIRVLAIHHPPLPEVPRRKALTDRQGLCALLARHRVDLVLCGHLHRFSIGEIAGPDRPVPVVVAPSASLLEEGDKLGGYVRLTFSNSAAGPAIELELRRFDPVGRSIVHGGCWQFGSQPRDGTVRRPGATATAP